MINWQNGTTPINETNMNKLVQEDMITDAYSSSSTYAVGDYCIYENTLYKCTTAIATAENWNSAHWTAVTVTDEIKENNEYSTEERRIGTWIDGKPLYRKVIQTTTPTVTANGTSAWQQVVMQNVKFGRVTDCQMLSNVANGTLLSPITRSTLAAGLNQFISVSFVNNTSNNTGVFQIESSSTTYNNRTVYAVIEYTKTTD